MKKLLLLLVVLFALNTAKAQFSFSVGSEIGYSLDKDLAAQFGFSLGGEYELNETMAITGQLGYSYISIPDYKTAFATNVPLLGGFKYSLDDKMEGLYVMGQLGIHLFTLSFKVDGKDYGNNYIELGTGLGVGYLIGDHIDLNLHLNAIMGEDAADGGMGDFAYIAARIAYKF